MDIKVNDTTVTVPDAVLTDFLGFFLIGKDYRNPAHNWGAVLNENTLKTALSLQSLRSALASVYTKSETDTAIDDRLNFLVGSAPQNLDTLYEIAQRLGEDDSKIAQILDLIASKVVAPIGSIHAYAGSVVPANHIVCDGSILSRSAYASLYSVIGDTFGAGDGLTTFKIPDLRGEFIRGFDAGRGVDFSRVLGSSQTDTIQNFTGVIQIVKSMVNAVSGVFTASVASSQPYCGTSASSGVNHNVSLSLANGGVRTSLETRPRNIALNYIIRVS